MDEQGRLVIEKTASSENDAPVAELLMRGGAIG
jgi:hypothetical protein